VFRAWDEGNNTQPDKPTWNLMGMLNNPWFRIKVHHQVHRSQVNASDDVDGEGVVVVGGVTKEEEEEEKDYISDATFEHPTLPGALSGGWMQAMKEHPALTAPGVFTMNDDGSNSSSNSSSSGGGEVKTTDEVATVAPPANTSIDPSIPTFTLEEIEQHNSKDSAWIVVKGRVYDCTPFLKAHPGGAESILIMAGQDATEDFEAVHSKKAWKMLEEYFIGVVGVVEEVRGPSSTSVSEHHHIDDVLNGYTNSSIEEKASYRECGDDVDVDNDSNPTTLNPKQRIKLPLVSRVDVSHDSILLRFGLPTPKHILGLPVGQHMLCYAKVEDKLVMRAYTPVTGDAERGYVELLIKVYRPDPSNEDDKGGKMSQHMDALQVGQTIEVKGPTGHVDYRAPSQLFISGELHQVYHMMMLCGGTGITPMYQVLKAVLQNPLDTVKVHMIYANRTEEDILLKDNLDALSREHPDRFSLHYMLSRPRQPDSWTGLKGHINNDIVQSLIPRAAVHQYAMICGPPGFLTSSTAALVAHGYSLENDTIISF